MVANIQGSITNYLASNTFSLNTGQSALTIPQD